jgi:glutamine cyclotransferase
MKHRAERGFLFRKYDYKTGKIYKQVDLDSKYFGEGITFLNDKLFNMARKTGFIYNATSLKLENLRLY